MCGRALEQPVWFEMPQGKSAYGESNQAVRTDRAVTNEQGPSAIVEKVPGQRFFWEVGWVVR